MSFRDYFKLSSQNAGVASWWNPEQSARSYLYEHEIKLLSKSLNSFARNTPRKINILEVASGGGRVRSRLEKYGSSHFKENINYTCVDINQDMNDRASKRFLSEGISADIIKASAERLPFRDKFFDVVICMNALVHFDSPIKVIQEVERVLLADGLFFGNIDNKYSLRRLIRKIDTLTKRAINSNYKERGEGLFRPLSNRAFRSQILQTKLKIVSEHRYGIFAPVDISFLKKRVYFPPIRFSKFVFPIDKAFSAIPGINTMSNYIFYIAKKS